ncbi:MAG: Crp/Fnr family transcriptional regulator [Pseudomonadota bacterium]
MREYTIGTILDISAALHDRIVSTLKAGRAPVRFAKGAVLYQQGDPADSILFLISGQVQSVLANAEGQTSLLRLHLPHSLLGLTALATTPLRDAQAIATVDCTAIVIPVAAFRGLLRKDPALSSYVIRMLVDRMSDFHHRVGDFHTRPVEERLAATLLSLSRPDPSDSAGPDRRPIALTHQELATVLGARRPTITAALQDFVAAGLIEKSGRSILVVDAPGLAGKLQDRGRA